MPDQLEPIHHVYYGFAPKLCEVQREDGTWLSAEIWSWDRDEQGRWSAFVGWTYGHGNRCGLHLTLRV